MKNIPIIGKFLAVLSVFGLFAIASTVYSTAQMRGVQQGYDAVAKGPLRAASLVQQANRDLVSLRQDIAQLLIVTTDAEDQAQLKAISTDRATLDTELSQAADLSPANASALLALKTQADATLDGECATTVRAGSAATSQQQDAAAQQEYLNNCSPLFPPLTQSMVDMQTTLDNQAADAEAGLAASTGTTIMLTFAIILAGLVVIMAGGFVAIRLWLVRPITGLQATMGKLSAGDYAAEVGGADRKDEIGGMARAVQVFKDAGIEKTRLERESEEARAQAAELRRKADAEREAAAKQLHLVVTALANGLEKLSSGDLLFRLDAPFTAEYEKLRTDFNQAMERLLETMKAIAANTAGVRAGASEINQASDDLSRRTEQQAASLEETAAALDQITATVKRAAESAKDARELVASAKSDAERSGDVVREMVGAMSGIETSSRQIGNIIGVIDEIAFQTNLLALNAGVEAARAGDAGRGFAVVATEVRALAQRSAEAAKEIKALISASGQQVDSGVKLVGETGKALVRIVEQVGKLNHLVSAIAASAQEQATALGEVNTAVNQMDQVTQRNAAMVEEATAASHSLAGEADDLAHLVGQFQIGAAAEPREPPAPVRRMPPKPARPRLPPRNSADKVVAFSRAGQAGAAAGAFEDASEF